MNKTFMIGMIGLLLVGLSSAYICINPQEDNINIQEFKMNLNNIALEEEINNGITPEALELKLKYFGPCR